MSDTPAGPGWWQAADGRWYPPTPGTPTPGTPSPPSGASGPPTSPPAGYGPPTSPPGGGFGPPTSPPGGGFGPPTSPPGGGFGPPTGPPGSPPPARSGGGNGVIVAVVAGFVVAVVVAVALGVVLTRDSGSGRADSTTTTTDGGGGDGEPLLLQQAGDAGPDPFTSSFADPDLPSLSAAATQAAGDVRAALGEDEASGALLGTGSEPGLYGGSRDNRVCDVEGLADFLEGEPEKAAAFAEVLGIDTDEIRDHLGGLTPVILVSDTWVTNHGFADGEATPFQAVLEAGTAVLVDDTGVPRVRCACGNPLAPPEPEGRSTESTDGDAWDGYEPGQVTVVEPGSTLATITLIDVETGEEFDRAIGAGQTGDVQVTLQWTGPADLDLHVFDPEGTEVYFAQRTSPSGGELDVDVIPGCDSGEESHTENVFWPTGSAPVGEYRVVVEAYDGCDSAAADFEVQVVVDGVVEVSESGSAPAGEEAPPYTFSVG